MPRIVAAVSERGRVGYIILRRVLEGGRDSGMSPCPGPTPIESSATSRGVDGVGLGEAVGEDLEEVDEVGLLGGGQPEVAHLAVERLPCRPAGMPPPGRE